MSVGVGLEVERNLIEDIRSLDLSVLQRVERLNQIATSRAGDAAQSPSHQLYDMCSICDNIILWKSSIEASCIARHEFVRCALTFLPIREPGISKYCESCNREFLDESLFAQSDSDEKISTSDYMEIDNQDNAQEATLVNRINTARSHDGDLLAHRGGEERISSNSGFRKALFARFDLCPYCQSKYVG
ncbi:MAG: hypothetical protein Q9181_006073 [Wetmoreana brouardii]